MEFAGDLLGRRTRASERRDQLVRKTDDAMGGLKGQVVRLDAPQLRSLGKRTKQFASLLIALGLCSFFLPMVILDSPVLNRTEWSALNIASKVYDGKLPTPGGSFDLGLIEVAMIYMLMPFALVAIYRPGPPKALKIISWTGVVLVVSLHFYLGPQLETFGYYERGQMRAGPAWWIVMCIMPALLAICHHKLLDN